ncbi:MAG: hypothetical protein ACYCZR_15105, partial [Burkholderiales bacterium]
MKSKLGKFAVIVLSASTGAAWPAFARSESQAQPLKPVERHAAPHAAKKSVAVSGTAHLARIPVAKRKKRRKPGKILLPIRISELLPEEGKQGGVARPKPVLSKA